MASSRSSRSRVCVGLSGGVDSVVLLDMLARDRSIALTAVHVHHGLSPNADAWASFCESLCRERGIALSVERVRIDREAPEGIEAAARAARYAVYAARPEPVVALAHHRDDQAETVLLQLLRGTGLKGVAAMPERRTPPGSKVEIWRPLLEKTRAQILRHARAEGLRWIDDESNAATTFDRNYVRHEIVPLLDARFRGWRENAARLSRHAAAAQALLDDLARIDGVPALPGVELPLDPRLPAERRANALRAFLAVNGLAMPSEARLAQMVLQLYGARRDRTVRLDHDGVALVRHRDCAHIETHSAPRAEAWRVAWHGESEVDLGPGRGYVRFRRARGAGLDPAVIAVGPWHFSPRAGGEKMRVAAQGRTRTLKNLLQEHAVPAWRRERLPLLFRGERLAWVPGIGVAAEFACQAGAEGIFPTWKVAANAPL